MADPLAGAVVQPIVSFAVEKLWELLSREVERLQGVHEQVSELKCQMRTLQSLLKDAYARKYESERVRNFLEDVQDIVDDAEDIIESFLLKQVKEKGIKKRAKSFFYFLGDRRKCAIDIEGITKRISELNARMQSFGIQQIMDGGRSMSLQERQRVRREIRQTFPYSSDENLVGVEQSVEELVGQLMNDNIQVVSISGMGGIGKTTLARKVFNHDNVRRHFDGFAWVCVLQEFTLKDIWQRILQDLRPHDGDIKQMDEHTLHGKLFQLLETPRYLIVLDDVWKNQDWDRIKAVFPQKRGSKMLLTSRNEGVGLHADPTCFSFRPKILTHQESWRLCESLLSPKRDETEFMIDEERKAMGKKMVTYCGGLPLAVKVLGGLLANKDTVHEWKIIYDNIQTQIVEKSGLDDKNLNSVYQIMSLSYEDLSMQLKLCFLHLAYFPEDCKIYLPILFHLWASEGIITSVCDGETIQESGENYLQELIRRNMVIVEWDGFSGSISDYCQMHAIMREVCLSKAKEDNFFQVIKVSTSTSTINAHTCRRSRRLVMHSVNAFHMLGHNNNNKKARSVLCFGVEKNLWKQSDQCFTSLPLLRVLDLTGANFEGGEVHSSIGELIHLRFLSLKKASVSHIPSSLQNLKLLLYLDLSVSMIPVHVPNILKEMLELRFLLLPYVMDDKTKLELGDLVNLEKLGYFSTKHTSVTDLVRMIRLRTLLVNFTGQCTCETLSSSLRELKNLEQFALANYEGSQGAHHGGDFALDFTHLKELVLAIHMPRFPYQYQFPPNLAHIRLYQCRMEEDPMPILEKLLHLNSVNLSVYGFVGKRMVCSKGGFPQLYDLKISEQRDLQEWIVEEGSMPCLRSLTINRCQKLKALPEGLKSITSLKELIIEGMNTEWTKKLIPDGEHYYKVQHIPSVRFI